MAPKKSEKPAVKAPEAKKVAKPVPKKQSKAVAKPAPKKLGVKGSKITKATKNAAMRKALTAQKAFCRMPDPHW